MVSYILVSIICIAGIVEAFFMALIDWEDLPISVRKSPRKIYNILKEELNLPKDWNDLSVIERRSRKKRYYIIRETLNDLPAWEELSFLKRRSHKDLYRITKSFFESVPEEVAVEVPSGTVLFEDDCSDDEADYYGEPIYFKNSQNAVKDITYQNDTLYLPQTSGTLKGLLPIKSLDGVSYDLEIDLSEGQSNAGIGFGFYNGDTDYGTIQVYKLQASSAKWSVSYTFYDAQNNRCDATPYNFQLDSAESVKFSIQDNKLILNDTEAIFEFDRSESTKYGLMINNVVNVYSYVKVATI